MDKIGIILPWQFLLSRPARSGVLITLGVLGILAFTSCSGPGHTNNGPLAKIGQQGNKEIEYPVSSAPYTYQIKKVPVTNTNNDTLFYVPDRLSQLVSFPCSKCHTGPLNTMAATDPTVKQAHWDITLEHATEEVLTCTTCHGNQNMEHLTVNNNLTIDFNRSQRNCAQCHSTQYKDWLGGAHGKQLGGWAPPRVSATCVNCHNPHAPALESRWPARLNTVKIKELAPK